MATSSPLLFNFFPGTMVWDSRFHAELCHVEPLRNPTRPDPPHRLDHVHAPLRQNILGDSWQRVPRDLDVCQAVYQEQSLGQFLEVVVGEVEGLEVLE
jgi:hypothetical protein